MIAWLGNRDLCHLVLHRFFASVEGQKKIKLSFKAHKTMAYITIVFATIHGLLVMFTYL